MLSLVVSNLVNNSLLLLLLIPSHGLFTSRGAGSGISILGRIALLDYGPKGIMHDQDGESLDLLESVATSLHIFKLTPNISIAILEKESTGSWTSLLLSEDFNIDLGEGVSSVLVGYLELTVSLDQVDLDLGWVVGLEQLNTTIATVDLDDHVLVLEVLRNVQVEFLVRLEIGCGVDWTV